MPEPADTADFLQIEIRVQSAESLRRLLANPLVDFGCRAATRRRPDGVVVIDAFIAAPLVDTLRRDGHEVDVVANASAVARQRAEEVGRADLFERGRPSRRGLVRDVPARPDAEAQ
jgi:hypothetical protein